MIFLMQTWFIKGHFAIICLKDEKQQKIHDFSTVMSCKKICLYWPLDGVHVPNVCGPYPTKNGHLSTVSLYLEWGHPK